MADNKVKFLRGTAAEYEASTKDSDVFYYTTDTKKLYLGTNEVTGEGITVDDGISFDIPETRENLVSGETIGQHFGKIAKFIDDLEDGKISCPANGGSADTVNNHTVNSDVPENAKFTDTTYELATSSTDGLMSATDKAILDKRMAYKLVSSSYQTVTIDVSDWNTLSSGGYACEKTLPVGLLYDNYIFDVSLSSDTDAAKLQLQSWNYIMADGRIEQSTSSTNGEKAASFTFYAFTTKPTVALTVAIQGVS